LPVGVFNAESYKLAPTGVLGGGQIGYNLQFANWVAGLEADLHGTAQKDSACVFECAVNIVLCCFAGTVEQKLPWFGTARGGLGIAASQTLFYATAGLAYGKVQTSVSQDAGTAAVVAASVSQTKTGWAFGGGLETALGGNWTARVEYLHIDLGSQSIAFLDP